MHDRGFRAGVGGSRGRSPSVRSRSRSLVLERTLRNGRSFRSGTHVRGRSDRAHIPNQDEEGLSPFSPVFETESLVRPSGGSGSLCADGFRGVAVITRARCTRGPGFELGGTLFFSVH